MVFTATMLMKDTSPCNQNEQSHLPFFYLFNGYSGDRCSFLTHFKHWYLSQNGGLSYLDISVAGYHGQSSFCKGSVNQVFWSKVYSGLFKAAIWLFESWYLVVFLYQFSYFFSKTVKTWSLKILWFNKIIVSSESTKAEGWKRWRWLIR